MNKFSDIKNNIHNLLDVIIFNLNIKVDYSNLENISNQIAREIELTNLEEDSILRICEFLDLNYYKVKFSIEEVFKVRDISPFFLIYLKNEYFNGWLIINKLYSNKAEIILINNEIKRKTLTKRKLEEFLNSTSSVQLEWYVIEEGLSINSIKSELSKISYFSKEKSPFKRLLGLLKDEKKDLVIIVAYSIFIGLLSLVVPVAVQSLVNTIAFASLIQPLVVLTFLVFIGLSFSALLRLLRYYLVEILQRRIFARVALDLSYRLPKVKTEAYDKNHGPELVNRFFDVLTIQKSAATLLVDGLTITLQTFTGMLLLAFYHPLLLSFDLILILFIFFVLFVLGRNAVYTSISESKIKYSVAAWLEEISRAHNLFKMPNNSIFAREKTNILLRKYIDARTSHYKIVFRQFIGSLSLQVISSAALLGIGGWLVINKQLTIGQLVASELIVTLIVSNFSKFGKYMEIYYDLMAAIDKLGYLIDLPIESKTGEKVDLFKNDLNIKADNISFHYTDKSKILDNACFKINSGDKILLLGKSGTGKSTLTDIFYGSRKIISGNLEINDIDIKDISLNSLRENILLIRENEIFQGTIAENIRAGKHNITDKDIRNVLDKVNLSKQIKNLPDGLYTLLSTGGSPLSKVMSFKLSIARAILNKPKMLILDGVLDIMDEESIKLLFDNIFNKDSSLILLVTSSNYNLSKFFNKSFELDKQLIETGNSK